MGLDFAYRKIVFPERENRVCWSYGGFHSFRNKLAKEININLDEMEGFTEAGKGKSWEIIEDPIRYLLNHSDSDGDLHPDLCREIYPRLLELIALWSNDDYDKQMGMRLATMMKECSESENECYLAFR